MKNYIILTVRRISLQTVILVSILLFALPSATARVWSPQEFPNVQSEDASRFVSDPENLMSASVRAEVDRYLASVRSETTCEIEVAIVPSMGDMSVEEWSEELFSLHKPGKKDRDNGILVVISPDDRVARISVGYGAEGVIPDISANRIIQRDIIPYMRDGDLDGAVVNSTRSIGEALSDPAVAEELRSEQTSESDVEGIPIDILWNFLLIVAGMAFLFTLVLFIHDIRESRRRVGNYQKALTWRSHIRIFWWATLISLGSGIIFALLAMALYRIYRNKPVRCDTCGARMHRLGEEEDNNLLSPSQDFEEKLKTVDYDVWECHKCGTIERFPFNERQLKYSRCPACGTIAMALAGNMTILKPTYRSAGQGVKIYRCKYCGHEHRDSYTIPKKENPVAPVIIGGMGGRSGGGGGFGGGGFGGGNYGGGGASGNW